MVGAENMERDFEFAVMVRLVSGSKARAKGSGAPPPLIYPILTNSQVSEILSRCGKSALFC